MAPRNSMIDSDFMDDGEEEQGHDSWQPPEDQELQIPKKGAKEPEVRVEIDDDTPEADRNKWVADDARDGEPEPVNDDEVRGYAKGAKKRISQVTARMHAERRGREQLARENLEAVNFARRLLAENNSLKQFVNQGEKVLLGEHRGRLQSVLEHAKSAYKEAHDAGDANGMVAAQEQIATAIAKMERASAQRPMDLQPEADPFANQQTYHQPPQEVAVQPDPDAVEWQKRNPWFGRDDAMTGFALGVHKKMVDDGVSPDHPEYYRRLDQELQTRFSDRLRGRSRRGPPPVGAASRTGSAAPRTVRISESQARLAKRLGLSVEQYAQQLVAEQDRSDGSGTFAHY
jgi:hypothetical protein